MFNYPPGRILEGGSLAGRLFCHLYEKFPRWHYVGISRWAQIPKHTNKDGTISIESGRSNFHDPAAKPAEGRPITIQDFKKNCPFAIAHDMPFENYVEMRDFDIISLGQYGLKVDWDKQFSHAEFLCKDTGYIVARYVKDPRFGEEIRRNISRFRVVDQTETSVVLQKNPDY